MREQNESIYRYLCQSLKKNWPPKNATATKKMNAPWKTIAHKHSMWFTMQLLKVRTQQKPMLVPQLISRKDDEFKEDNKALNDQGEGEGTNFCLP